MTRCSSTTFQWWNQHTTFFDIDMLLRISPFTHPKQFEWSRLHHVHGDRLNQCRNIHIISSLLFCLELRSNCTSRQPVPIFQSTLQPLTIFSIDTDTCSHKCFNMFSSLWRVRVTVCIEKLDGRLEILRHRNIPPLFFDTWNWLNPWRRERPSHHCISPVWWVTHVDLIDISPIKLCTGIPQKRSSLHDFCPHCRPQSNPAPTANWHKTIDDCEDWKEARTETKNRSSMPQPNLHSFWSNLCSTTQLASSQMDFPQPCWLVSNDTPFKINNNTNSFHNLCGTIVCPGDRNAVPLESRCQGIHSSLNICLPSTKNGDIVHIGWSEGLSIPQLRWRHLLTTLQWTLNTCRSGYVSNRLICKEQCPRPTHRHSTNHWINDAVTTQRNHMTKVLIEDFRNRDPKLSPLICCARIINPKPFWKLSHLELVKAVSYIQLRTPSHVS